MCLDTLPLFSPRAMPWGANRVMGATGPPLPSQIKCGCKSLFSSSSLGRKEVGWLMCPEWRLPRWKGREARGVGKQVGVGEVSTVA